MTKRAQLKPISIHPGIGFGRPCLTGTGIQVRIIAERFRDGETMQALAKDYRISRQQVEDAIRYQMRTVVRRRDMVQPSAAPG